MNTQEPANEQSEIRRQKLALRREAGSPFPNHFRRDALAGQLHQSHEDKSGEELESEQIRVKVAGRMMAKRVMGKASFAHLQDVSGKIQLFLQRDTLPEGVYNNEFKKFDVGDILGIEGELFRTKTGELTIRVDAIELLVKSLRALPEKFHGLTDQEIRYRQRYVDLIMNPEVRETFRIRSRIVEFIRRFLSHQDFLEVETPMMQAIPGGAVARPFETHHNALGMDLFLRIAPELYLKRLVVGGFEKVFEINRNFRNEGISAQHNPEFTMLEFYWAYADYHDLMDLTEAMMRECAKEVLGSSTVDYQGESFDLETPFVRMTVSESVLHYNQDLDLGDLGSIETLRSKVESLGLPVKESWGEGKLLLEIFEKTVEEQLRSPTFITAYPVEVSPLSRRNDDDPSVSDRFELFVSGREIANGFSELNDAEDQAERFHHQVREKEAGDNEAMHYDADYVRALEYGLPPTAGEGIGIDRLVMLMTDSPSIRDVLLFPHMRAESIET
ncbi:MAG: lysine--tRNA ligase [Acidiferrobacteraceae bacterium]|nr:lysine--tRNA ligase [Acidiferrobacteraceae bacterium]MAG01580.1 lysine--tRNA ligase [Acidiferrobacteraceae bacterium]MDP6434413.1 lysine--tRNA ligase [Arenicellales bacterium]MDP6671712.1 lysine--tRNA ligase [Arenicellales bacterium]MDP6723611.1 lysine--tRNA ligase [Arenicellales bacterium]